MTKTNHNQIKTVCLLKDYKETEKTSNKVGKDIWTHTTGKGLVTRICKQHLQLSKKKMDNSIEEENNLELAKRRNPNHQEVYTKLLNFTKEMQIKTARKYSYPPIWWKFTKHTMPSFGLDKKPQDAHKLPMELKIGENGLALLMKIGDTHSQWSSNSTCGICLPNINSYIGTHQNVCSRKVLAQINNCNDLRL